MEKLRRVALAVARAPPDGVSTPADKLAALATELGVHNAIQARRSCSVSEAWSL